MRLVWSFVLDFEVRNNPALDRREPIEKLAKLANTTITPLATIQAQAEHFQSLGIKPMDALHLACATHAGCDFFFTTDKGILKKRTLVAGVTIMNPVDFIESEEDIP